MDKQLSDETRSVIICPTLKDNRDSVRLCIFISKEFSLIIKY